MVSGEFDAGTNGDADVKLPLGKADADLDLKIPETSGSMKPKGKGGFKFPFFNRKKNKKTENRFVYLLSIFNFIGIGVFSKRSTQFGAISWFCVNL